MTPELEVIVNDAYDDAINFLKKISGNGESVTGSALLKLSVLAKIVPVIFREYRDRIICDDETAKEVHYHIDFSVEVIAHHAPRGTRHVTFKSREDN